MLTAARRGAGRLGARRGPLVRFVRGRLTDEGGFADRHGRGDLYYTVFGAECLRACGERVPAAVGEYVRRFGPGDGLDLVHLACVVRLRTAAGDVNDALRDELLGRLRNCPAPGVYAAFLALAAAQDLGAPPPDADKIVADVQACRTPDGGYANLPGIPLAMTPTTAAAAIVLAALGRAVEPAAVNWLAGRRCDGGGYAVADGAAEAELLSTAVALHALAVAGAAPADDPATGAFVQSLQCDGGGFRGHRPADEADCEYTFYGLLALGSLPA